MHASFWTAWSNDQIMDIMNEVNFLVHERTIWELYWMSIVPLSGSILAKRLTSGQVKVGILHVVPCLRSRLSLHGLCCCAKTSFFVIGSLSVAFDPRGSRLDDATDFSLSYFAIHYRPHSRLHTWLSRQCCYLLWLQSMARISRQPILRRSDVSFGCFYPCLRCLKLSLKHWCPSATRSFFKLTAEQTMLILGHQAVYHSPVLPFCLNG